LELVYTVSPPFWTYGPRGWNVQRQIDGWIAALLNASYGQRHKNPGSL